MADDASKTGGDSSTTTVSLEDFNKSQERAQRFEGLLTTREKEFNEFKKKFEGVDPEAFRQAIKDKEEADRKLIENDPEKLKEHYEKKMRKALEDTEGKYTPVLEENKTLKGKVKTLAVTEKVMSEIDDAFTQDGKRWIKQEVERRADLDEEGNIVFKNDKNEILYNGAKPFTAKDFQKLLIEENPSLAKSTVVGGTQGNTPGQKIVTGGTFTVPNTMAELNDLPNPRAVWSKLTAEQKMKLGATMKLGAKGLGA